MKVLLSGEEQKTMVVAPPVRYIPKAVEVLKVKPIEPKETTEDKIKKFVTWGSLGLLVYKILS